MVETPPSTRSMALRNRFTFHYQVSRGDSQGVNPISAEAQQLE
ncbi:hypothetical protein [Moorena sp. SIOASIH]|nr:hypothetical protein [Moorena sp. SIOASIH]